MQPHAPSTAPRTSTATPSAPAPRRAPRALPQSRAASQSAATSAAAPPARWLDAWAASRWAEPPPYRALNSAARDSPRAASRSPRAPARLPRALGPLPRARAQLLRATARPRPRAAARTRRATRGAPAHTTPRCFPAPFLLSSRPPGAATLTLEDNQAKRRSRLRYLSLRFRLVAVAE